MPACELPRDPALGPPVVRSKRKRGFATGLGAGWFRKLRGRFDLPMVLSSIDLVVRTPILRHGRMDGCGTAGRPAARPAPPKGDADKGRRSPKTPDPFDRLEFQRSRGALQVDQVSASPDACHTSIDAPCAFSLTGHNQAWRSSAHRGLRSHLAGDENAARRPVLRPKSDGSGDEPHVG